MAGCTEKVLFKKSIYVLLTVTGTLFTRLIKRITSAPYNHASLALEEDLNRLFSFGRKNVNNPFHAGFVQENVYRGIYRNYPNTRCILLRLNVSEEQYYAANTIIRTFQRNTAFYTYNLIGVLGIFFGIRFTVKNAYFCSQFVAEVLHRLGLALWECPCIGVTPNDFFLHPSFEKVYEGLLYEFPLLDQTRLLDCGCNIAHFKNEKLVV